MIAVLFDVDGTLVDSNDAHARAWVAAFAEHGITVDLAQARKCIGMGGDKLMPEVSGVQRDSPSGTAIASRRAEIFAERFLPHLKPFSNSERLVAALKDRGHTVVAASSAPRKELGALLAVAGVDALMDATTSSDDAQESKPEPDIIQAALKRAKAAAANAVMIGDTPYDVEASQRAGVAVIAFRCGGWDDEALRGAIAVYDGPWDLLSQLDESPLGRR
jgi:HAD superfamily hydrolase (TIGR01509 family)